MIKIEKGQTYGWEETIRGMRNPLNSWDRMDSFVCEETDDFNQCLSCPKIGHCDIEDSDAHFVVGKNDHDLMMRLAKGGPAHAKYRRMITVYADITAPLYWWKEFDTYKVGTVANSCSTMHKIHAKEFTLDDFSHEHLGASNDGWVTDKNGHKWCDPLTTLETVVFTLNACRDNYLATKDKIWWWQMIQLLPSSYNQKRTVMVNYEVLNNMYHSRKNHKLDEWRDFCEWIKTLPYSELIIGEEKNDQG